MDGSDCRSIRATALRRRISIHPSEKITYYGINSAR